MDDNQLSDTLWFDARCEAQVAALPRAHLHPALVGSSEGARWLEAYHLALDVCQAEPCGHRLEGEQLWCVFFDCSEDKFVLNLSAEDRLEHHQVTPTGSLRHLVLDRVDGPAYDLRTYLHLGLLELWDTPAEFVRMPGWRLVAFTYERVGDLLVGARCEHRLALEGQLVTDTVNLLATE